MRKYLLLIGLVLAEILTAQDTRISQLDSLFTVLQKEGRFNGNVLIAEKGETLFQKSYGYADLDTKRELTDDTVFDIASVTKEFTAIAITLLQNEGKLDYDDKISKFIPKLDFYGDVTVRQLIQHTSGLPLLFPTFQKHWKTSQIATNKDVVSLFAEHRPAINFLPNDDFEYNNTNYVLLGVIIERLSGMTYSEFLKTRIFKPLGMNRTQVYCRYYDGYEIPDYALGYVPDKEGNAQAVDNLPDTDYRHFLDGIVGAGQIKSTVGDLLKWDRALYTEEIVSDEDKEILFSPAILNDGRTVQYGFGWVIKNDNSQRKSVYHPGRWGGYINHFERDISNDLTIIVLTNNDLPKTVIPRNRIRNILYNIHPKKVPASLLAELAGNYINENDETLEIRKEDGELYYVRGGNDVFRMMPKSERRFLASQYLFEVEFEFDKSPEGKQQLRFISSEDGTEKVFVREN